MGWLGLGESVERHARQLARTRLLVGGCVAASADKYRFLLRMDNGDTGQRRYCGALFGQASLSM